MTKYVETINVQPTSTKTIFVEGGTFSWGPQGDRLAGLGVVEVPEGKKASPAPQTNKKAERRK